MVPGARCGHPARRQISAEKSVGWWGWQAWGCSVSGPSETEPGMSHHFIQAATHAGGKRREVSGKLERTIDREL